MSDSGELRNALQHFNNGIAALESAFNKLASSNRIILAKINFEKSTLLRLFGEIVRSYRTLEDRYRSVLRQSFSIIRELRTERDHLRLVTVERTENVDQIQQLRDELEVVRSQFALQDQIHREELQDQAAKHRDEIEQFEARRERELTEYQKMIAKLSEKALSENVKKVKAKIIAKTTRVYENRKKKKKKIDNLAQKWPDLNIQKIEDPATKNTHQQPTNDNNILNSKENISFDKEENVVEAEKELSKRKKRKLFCEDKDTLVDILPKP